MFQIVIQIFTIALHCAVSLPQPKTEYRMSYIIIIVHKTLIRKLIKSQVWLILLAPQGQQTNNKNVGPIKIMISCPVEPTNLWIIIFPYIFFDKTIPPQPLSIDKKINHVSKICQVDFPQKYLQTKKALQINNYFSCTVIVIIGLITDVLHPALSFLFYILLCESKDIIFS